MVKGTVFDARVRREGGGHGPLLAEIVYSFSVNGEYFSGSERRAYETEKAAEKFLGRFRRGQSVFIRYDPANLEMTTLRDQDNLHLAAAGPAAQILSN
jgi:hypothetical protein